MYTWVKVVISLTVILIVGGIILIIRSYNTFKDDVIQLPATIIELPSQPGNLRTESTGIEKIKSPEEITEELQGDLSTEIMQNSIKTEAVKLSDNFNIKLGNYVKPTPFIKDSDFEIAKNLYSQNKLIEARDTLWKIISDKKLTENDDLFWQCGELLSEINTKILFSNINAPEKIVHKIERGDSLEKLAKMYKTTVAAIQKSNNMKLDNTVVQLGKTYKIYPGVWSIKGYKNKFKAILFDDGKVFKIYNISTGKQYRTPLGKFKIVTKQINPDWSSEEKIVKFGEPENPLGTRWIGLQDLNEKKVHYGYGLHGTWEPELIGKEASNGCLRFKNEDIEELYNIVPYNIEVTIVE